MITEGSKEKDKDIVKGREIPLENYCIECKAFQRKSVYERQ